VVDDCDRMVGHCGASETVTADFAPSVSGLPSAALTAKGSFCGLEVTKEPPNSVILVDDVLDVNGMRQGEPGYSNPEITPGDRILTIDGRAAEHVSTNELHSFLRGSLHSVVEIGLAHPVTSETYTVHLSRHATAVPSNFGVPTTSQEMKRPDTVLGRYALHDHAPSQSQRTTPRPDTALGRYAPDDHAAARSYAGSVGNPDHDEALVGVGILMQQDPQDGALYVKSCVRGGAAARSGKFFEGDRIIVVDGHSCAEASVAQAREMIVGIEGTVVRIVLQNPIGDQYEVSLTRGTAEYLDRTSDPGPSRTQALLNSANMTLEKLNPQRSAPLSELSASNRGEHREKEKLRLRNTELEMEVANLQTVVARLQQQVDFERGSAKSVSHEVELIQKKYSDQIRDLHSTLNVSEKKRRDAEQQCSNQQHREATVHEAIERAKEQADQREKFYGDLCTKLEEERNHFEALLVSEKEARIRSDDERRQAEQTLDRMMREIDRIKTAERRRRDVEGQLLQRMNDSEGQLREAKSEEERVRLHSIENVQIFSQWQNDFFSSKTSQEAEVDNYFLA